LPHVNAPKCRQEQVFARIAMEPVIGPPANSKQNFQGTFTLVTGKKQFQLRRGGSTELGLALMILGIIALCTVRTNNPGAVILFGWIIVVSGVVEAVEAFRARRSERFFLHLIPAIAGVPIGLLIAAHPAAGPLTWMLLFASFFTVIGLFRIISAFWLKFSHWEWTAFDGLAALLLGSLLWAAWPWENWFFGLAVGISLILRAWSSIMFSLGPRSQPQPHLHVPERHDEQPKSSHNSYRIEATNLH
jgi:uncharacterized membrane protein HdeD (DUF308 family)